MCSYPWVKIQIKWYELIERLRRIQLGTRITSWLQRKWPTCASRKQRNRMTVLSEPRALARPVPGQVWKQLNYWVGGCDIKIGKNSQASWAPIASKSWMLGEFCAGFFGRHRSFSSSNASRSRCRAEWSSCSLARKSSCCRYRQSFS